jgi:hypothetical protein
VRRRQLQREAGVPIRFAPLKRANVGLAAQIRSAMSFAPHCAYCVQPIAGRIITYQRANCCESCYTRLSGGRSIDEIETAEREAASARVAKAEASRRLQELNAGSQPRRKQYKVLTQYDGFFSGVFRADKIEAAINHYSEAGWCVVSMATASVPGLVGTNEELIVLFERDYFNELPCTEREPARFVGGK